MLTIGAMSMIVAACMLCARTVGRITMRVDGAIPKVHTVEAPITTEGFPTASRPFAPGTDRGRFGTALRLAPYSLDPLTDLVSVAPVVVTKQVTDRSSVPVQLRADGSR
jgi:hypothetical protein